MEKEVNHLIHTEFNPKEVRVKRRKRKAIELDYLGPGKKLGFAFYELGEIDEKTTKENIVSKRPVAMPYFNKYDSNKVMLDSDDSSANSSEKTPTIHKMDPSVAQELVDLNLVSKKKKNSNNLSTPRSISTTSCAASPQSPSQPTLMEKREMNIRNNQVRLEKLGFAKSLSHNTTKRKKKNTKTKNTTCLNMKRRRSTRLMNSTITEIQKETVTKNEYLSSTATNNATNSHCTPSSTPSPDTDLGHRETCNIPELSQEDTIYTNCFSNVKSFDQMSYVSLQSKKKKFNNNSNANSVSLLKPTNENYSQIVHRLKRTQNENSSATTPVLRNLHRVSRVFDVEVNQSIHRPNVNTQIELRQKRSSTLTKVIDVKNNGPSVFIDDDISMKSTTDVEGISIPSDIKEILERVENADYNVKKAASDKTLEMDWITEELDRKITKHYPTKKDIIDTKTGARNNDTFKVAVSLLFHKDAIFASKKQLQQCLQRFMNEWGACCSVRGMQIRCSYTDQPDRSKRNQSNQKKKNI